MSQTNPARRFGACGGAEPVEPPRGALRPRARYRGRHCGEGGLNDIQRGHLTGYYPGAPGYKGQLLKMPLIARPPIFLELKMFY